MYEVLYQPQETFNGAIGDLTVNVSAPETSVVLMNLQEYVNYTISVRAYTSVGEGPYSEGIVELTNEDSKCRNCEELFAIIPIFDSSCHTPYQCQCNCYVTKDHHCHVGGGGTNEPEWSHHCVRGALPTSGDIQWSHWRFENECISTRDVSGSDESRGICQLHYLCPSLHQCEGGALQRRHCRIDQ